MASRVRWAVLFALLPFAVVAAPVLASGESSGEVPPGEAPSSGEGFGPPIDGDTPNGIEAVELEEREQAEWLLSPEAIQQREASQDAFTGLSAGEAQSLLVEVFPMQLQELNAVPVQSNLGGGGNEPVDLVLERSDSAFVPQNPTQQVPKATAEGRCGS